MAEPLRVLIVEDSQGDTLLLLHELKQGGFAPAYERVDNREALREALERSTWDVVLADYNLPGFSAPEALSLLKRLSLDIPFLIVSGSTSEEVAVASLHAGASDFIVKERLARLVPAIRRELREAEGRAARRQAERALRESEERYRSLIEHSSDIITVADPHGTIRFENPSVERVLGYRPEDRVGRNLFDYIHPDEREKAAASLRRLVDQKAPNAVSEMRQRHRDGSWRVLEVTSTTLSTREEQLEVLSVSRDITERKLLEEQLRHSQKMEAVGRLAGGVAHDFNNLLTAILGYSDLLADQLNDQPRFRQDVGEIRRAAERAATLTRQLLAFSRRQVLSPRVLDLNEIVTSMDGMLRPLIGEDIELLIVPAPDVGHVRADRGQIEQVVLNLVVNSRDAMPDGGKVTIETANVELGDSFSRRHIAAPPGPYVMLAVSDTGHGMDAEALAHLFEPFFTTKELGKGTGLGLSMVYGIVKQSGGSIWVYSEPGHGTTFKVYLPRVEEAIEPGEIEAPEAEVPRGTETILLVEDEDIVRALVRDLLRKNGYTVLEADDGQKALAMSRDGAAIDLVISDVVMPGMNGVELIAHLRDLHPALRVLFVSGYTDKGLVHQGKLDANTAFLQKPFTPGALLRKVREVIREPNPPAPARRAT